MTDEESLFESLRRDLDGPTDNLSEPADAIGGEMIDESLAENGPVVESEIEKVSRERDEYLDALRRLQADFENFRKRTARQQTEMVERASWAVLEHVLPALDALDLALAHADQEGGDSSNDNQTALVQVAGLLRSILEKEGLERIDEVDVAFDPTLHDGVEHLESSESGGHSGPTVSKVLRSGYKLKGRVVRPAMVSVTG